MFLYTKLKTQKVIAIKILKNKAKFFQNLPHTQDKPVIHKNIHVYIS